MRTPSVRHGVIPLLLLLMMIGCSDDDCPSCPAPDPIQALMIGDIWLNGSTLTVEGHIFDLEVPLPEVDSILVDGEKATLKPVTNDGIWGYEFQYVSTGSNNVITSGDQVPIDIFTPSGKCSSSPRVLDKTTDKPDVLGWSMGSPSDTVAIGANIEIAWNHVAHADWYEVRTYYQYRDPQGGIAYWRETVRQTDTLYTMPNEATAYDGDHQIVVSAYAGPFPDDPDGNISGEIIRGVINSHASRRFTIFVGSGIEWLNQSAQSLEEK